MPAILPLLGLAGAAEYGLTNWRDARQEEQLRSLIGSFGQQTAGPNPADAAMGMGQPTMTPGLDARQQEQMYQMASAGGPFAQQAAALLGMRAMPGFAADGTERKIVEGADGFKYYADTGERVLPNVQSKPREDKSFEREAKLRGEFTKGSKEFVDMTNAFTRINESVQEPSAAGDLALVFNYMKMLDPASVVRESEFATAQNAAGVPDIIRAQWNRLKRGERLSAPQRSDFFDRARRLYQGAEQNQSRLIGRYTDLATMHEFDPARVVYDYSLPMDQRFDMPVVPPTDPAAVARSLIGSGSEETETEAEQISGTADDVEKPKPKGRGTTRGGISWRRRRSN